MGGWEDVVTSSDFELVDITLRSDLGRICVSRLWEIRFSRATHLDLVRYSLACPHAGRLDYQTRLWPPILDLVGVSPGSPHAGR